MRMASLQLQHSSWLSSFTKKKPTCYHHPSKSSTFKVSLSLYAQESSPEPQPAAPVDPVKLAFEKVKLYKKGVEESKSLKLEQNPAVGSDGKAKQVPVSIKIAMAKAKEYNKNKEVVGGAGGGRVAESGTSSGSKRENSGNLGTGNVEKSSSKNEKLSISSIDFKGLDFADKKSVRGFPAGLVPITDPFSDGDLPRVEIIIRDTSKFGDTTMSMPKPSQEDNSVLYKPKVSTWGREHFQDRVITPWDSGKLEEANSFSYLLFVRLSFVVELFPQGLCLNNRAKSKELPTMSSLSIYLQPIGRKLAYVLMQS